MVIGNCDYLGVFVKRVLNFVVGYMIWIDWEVVVWCEVVVVVVE